MTILDRYPTVEKPERFDKGTLQLDETKLFPPISTESEDLVGYLRTGGCTSGCGACCEAFVVPISKEGWEHEDWRGVVNGQIVLPINPDTRERPGGADWEYWLTLHDVFMFRSPRGVLTTTVPIKAKGDAPVDSFENWMTWLEGHGITFLQQHEQSLVAYVKVACGKLEEGMCTVFGTPERPKMCSPYPQHPLEVQGIDFCTYNFQPVTRKDMLALRPVSSPSKSSRKKRKKNKSRKKQR